MITANISPSAVGEVLRAPPENPACPGGEHDNLAVSAGGAPATPTPGPGCRPGRLRDTQGGVEVWAGTRGLGRRQLAPATPCGRSGAGRTGITMCPIAVAVAERREFACGYKLQ